MTRICYLIGYPVGHSLSAIMHNAAFSHLGLDYRYELRSVKLEDLEAFALSMLKTPEVRGANVTIPHKIAVVRYLDEIDVVAARIGAVNTIVNDAGRLRGYNTDGLGAMRALEEAFGDLRGTKVLILGAGGSAKAIGYHISTQAREIVLLNRTLDRAIELADSLSRSSECKAYVSAKPLNRDCLTETIEGADIIINATPLGMSPKIEETPVARELLTPGILVFDVVYNPPETRLLKEAEAAGARTLTGVRMLVYQGAEAFRLWTGKEAPEELMMEAVEKALKGV